MSIKHLLTVIALLSILINMLSTTAFQINDSAENIINEEKNPIVQPNKNPLISYQKDILKKYSYFLSALDSNSDSSLFQPENLTDTDDAYHGSNQTYSTEWWYFDAKLNNEYTLQFSIHLYDILNTGFATINCNIYNKGKPIIAERNIHSLKNLSFSKKIPFITLNDKTVMKAQQTSPIPRYILTFSGSNFSFNLTFTQITKGWKGTTNAGGWAVIFPKAIVGGTLNIEEESHLVQGTGYHDHNWNVTISSGLNFGWLWGKTITNNYTLTWANIYETWYKDAPLLVVNKDWNGYSNIPSDQIRISVTDFQFKNGMIIPIKFIISAKTKTCYLNINIEVIKSDYITVLGLINYWRYHIHTSGILQIDNQTEHINDYNIAEFIRFRPY